MHKCKFDLKTRFKHVFQSGRDYEPERLILLSHITRINYALVEKIY